LLFKILIYNGETKIISEFIETIIEIISDDENSHDHKQIEELRLQLITNIHKILKYLPLDLINKTNIIPVLFSNIEDDEDNRILPVILKNLMEIIKKQEEIENYEFFKLLSTDKIIKKFEGYMKEWRQIEKWLRAIKK